MTMMMGQVPTDCKACPKCGQGHMYLGKSGYRCVKTIPYPGKDGSRRWSPVVLSDGQKIPTWEDGCGHTAPAPWSAEAVLADMGNFSSPRSVRQQADMLIDLATKREEVKVTTPAPTPEPVAKAVAEPVAEAAPEFTPDIPFGLYKVGDFYIVGGPGENTYGSRRAIKAAGQFRWSSRPGNRKGRTPGPRGTHNHWYMAVSKMTADIAAPFRMTPTSPRFDDEGNLITTERRVPATPAPATPAPVRAPVQRATIEVAATSMRERIEVNAARNDRLTAHLSAHGFATEGKLIYENGRPVNGTGRANVKARRQANEDQPLVIEGCAAIAAAVEAEERRSNHVDIATARMNDDGAVTFEGYGLVPLETGAFHQLIAAQRDEVGQPIFPAAGRFLESIEPAHRASIFNREMRRAASKTMKQTTRTLSGGRGIMAINGPKFPTEMHAGAVAQAVAQGLRMAGLDKTLRGESMYTPNGGGTLSIEGTYSVSEAIDVSCGELIQAGIHLRSKDNGTGAISAWHTALRNLCLNLIILGKGRGLIGGKSIAHKGSPDKMARALAKKMRAGTDFLAPLAEEWGYIKHIYVQEVMGKLMTPAQVEAIEGAKCYDRQGRSKKLLAIMQGFAPMVDVKRDVAVELLLSGYDAEPASDIDAISLAHIVNAVTRVHESAIPLLAQRKVEASAGEMFERFAKLAAI